MHPFKTYQSLRPALEHLQPAHLCPKTDSGADVQLREWTRDARRSTFKKCPCPATGTRRRLFTTESIVSGLCIETVGLCFTETRKDWNSLGTQAASASCTRHKGGQTAYVGGHARNIVVVIVSETCLLLLRCSMLCHIHLRL